MSAVATTPIALDTVAAHALPGLTVIVPTLNRGGFLRDTLCDLVAQSHRPLEILVVDQSVTRNSEVDAIVAAYPDLIRYHRVTFRGLPQARNYGWQHASFDYLLYVDDDIRCGPELVTEHLRVLTRPGIGLVGGGVDEDNLQPCVDLKPPTFDRWSATPGGGFANRNESAAAHGKGCNFSVRREALVRVSGVDEALSVGASLYEETDLALRVANKGYNVRFCGAARVRHLAAASGGCRTDQIRDYVYALAHNRTVLIRRHSRAVQAPVAGAHLASTVLAFAWRYRSPGCLWSAFRGALSGWREGSLRPRCTGPVANTGVRR